MMIGWPTTESRACRGSVRPFNAMRRDSEVLDPYCRFCGRYKGVGPCRYSDCPGSPKPGQEKHDGLLSERPDGDRSTSSYAQTCCICNEPRSVTCSVCGRIYCGRHSESRSEVTMIGPDQHIGTCVKCGQLVCEHCWILDKLGRITCIKHLEE
jgi:hypothetical protein